MFFPRNFAFTMSRNDFLLFNNRGRHKINSLLGNYSCDLALLRSCSTALMHTCKNMKRKLKTKLNNKDIDFLKEIWHCLGEKQIPSLYGLSAATVYFHLPGNGNKSVVTYVQPMNWFSENGSYDYDQEECFCTGIMNLWKFIQTSLLDKNFYKHGTFKLTIRGVHKRHIKNLPLPHHLKKLFWLKQYRLKYSLRKLFREYKYISKPLKPWAIEWAAPHYRNKTRTQAMVNNYKNGRKTDCINSLKPYGCKCARGFWDCRCEYCEKIPDFDYRTD